MKWGVGLLIAFVCLGLMAPVVSSGPTLDTEDVVLRRFLPPMSGDGLGSFHILGTDEYGRDLLGRIAYGARVSIGVGVVAVMLALIIGTTLGITAGLGPPAVDITVTAAIDGMLALPRLVVLLALVSIWEGSVALVILTIGFTGWMGIARLVRAEVKTLRERGFVAAARASGSSSLHIATRHLLPNAMTPALVAAALSVGNAIALEAGLSFLGLGVPPDIPSWGNILAGGRDALINAPWIATVPGICIALTVVGANKAAEDVRRRFDR